MSMPPEPMSMGSMMGGISADDDGEYANGHASSPHDAQHAPMGMPIPMGMPHEPMYSRMGGMPPHSMMRTSSNGYASSADDTVMMAQQAPMGMPPQPMYSMMGGMPPQPMMMMGSMPMGMPPHPMMAGMNMNLNMMGGPAPYPTSGSMPMPSGPMGGLGHGGAPMGGPGQGGAHGSMPMPVGPMGGPGGAGPRGGAYHDPQSSDQPAHAKGNPPGRGPGTRSACPGKDRGRDAQAGGRDQKNGSTSKPPSSGGLPGPGQPGMPHGGMGLPQYPPYPGPPGQWAGPPPPGMYPANWIHPGQMPPPPQRGMGQGDGQGQGQGANMMMMPDAYPGMPPWNHVPPHMAMQRIPQEMLQRADVIQQAQMNHYNEMEQNVMGRLWPPQGGGGPHGGGGGPQGGGGRQALHSGNRKGADRAGDRAPFRAF
eukprot:gene24699-10334_t